MSTMEKLETLGITLEASEETIAEINKADKFNATEEKLKQMSQADRDVLRREAEDVMDAYDSYDTSAKALYESAEACYWRICRVEDALYREENMADFRAYEMRMMEPEFDWEYYSDWHKEMFGYRPHFNAIPADDAARENLFETWHKARGL